jgi:branched-subunit amino acid ABC-type transport system permease component
LIIDELLREVMSSILVSALYALAALGLTLSFKVTKIANLAHAEYIVIGSYVAAYLTLIYIDPLLSLLVSALIIGSIAIIIDELFYKPLYRRGATSLQLFVASIGAGLFLRYLLSIYADMKDLLFLNSAYSRQPIFYLGYGVFTNLHILSLSTLTIYSFILYLILFRTKIGRGIRAVASNIELAQVSGIPVWRIRRLTWFLAGAAAGLAGGLWSYYTSVNPESGWRLLLWVFASSAIGGFTSLWQTLLGGFIVGFSENVVMWSLNRSFGIDPAYKPLIPYVIIVFVLIFRRKMFLMR